MIIGVDVDGPVADLLTAWLAVYNRDWKDNLQPNNITNWDLSKHTKSWCGDKIYDYLTPELYNTVLPTIGALEGIRELRARGHQVVFVTVTPRGSFDAKLDWLIKYGFIEGGGVYGDGRIYADYFPVANKGLLKLDVLIDDRPENFKGFKGEAILYTQQHNIEEEGYYRADNWAQAITIIQHLTPTLENLVDNGIHFKSGTGGLSEALRSRTEGTQECFKAQEICGKSRDSGASAPESNREIQTEEANLGGMSNLYAGSHSGSRPRPSIRPTEGAYLQSLQSAPGTRERQYQDVVGGNTVSEQALPQAIIEDDWYTLPPEILATLQPEPPAGLKYDEDKVDWSLFPWAAGAEVVKVLMFGARKYSAYNWALGMKWTRLTSAAIRHIAAFVSGQDHDEESKLSHLAHAACCILFLLSYQIAGMSESDDRPLTEAARGVTLPSTRYTG